MQDHPTFARDDASDALLRHGPVPFTLEDGTVTFHDDGSTELHITIPPGKTEESNLLDAQYNRLVTRLLELALAWQQSDEDELLHRNSDPEEM